MDRIVVALYRDLDPAREAIRELRDQDFDREGITLIANDVGGEYSKYLPEETAEVADDTLEGAGIGAVVGGLGGLVAGLAALAIPGVGPVVLAGPLVSTLAGAGIGAVAGGFLGALMDIGIPEEQAHAFAEGIRRGGTMVAVQVPEERAAQVVEILNTYNPVDMDRFSARLKEEEEWQGFSESGKPLPEDEMEKERERFTEALHETQEEMQLEEPIGVHIESRQDTHDEVEPIFREHFENSYTEPDYTYANLRPGYLFGFELGYNDRLADREWEEIWPEAQREWKRQHPETVWSSIKDAVKKGYATAAERRGSRTKRES